MLNLDTHILIYSLSDELTTKERRILRQHEWCVSAIVLWELAKLVQLGRIELDLESLEVSRLFGHIQVLPIDLAVARVSTVLDVESDPVDELIAATSVVHKVPLLTRDRALRRSRMIPLA